MTSVPVALKWWKEQSLAYPHQCVTERIGLNPQTAREQEGLKDIDFICAGTADGRRIWGFRTKSDMDRFTHCWKLVVR